MKFTKIQSCGNDYVCIELFTQSMSEPCEFAKRISAKHYGVGSDGMILVCPSQKADFRMRIFNVDGTEGLMCGNGLRVASKLFYDKGLTDRTELSVETQSGIKHVTLTVSDGAVTDASAEIGHASFDCGDIPCTLSDSKNECITQKVDLGDAVFDVTAVSFGNPHCCIVCDEPEDIDLQKYGSMLEKHAIFPDRANVEFFKLIDKNNIYIRTYERGCGETLGCATGSAACVATAIRLGLVAKTVNVHQRGGCIGVFVDKQGNYHLHGKPIAVFEGVTLFDDEII